MQGHLRCRSWRLSLHFDRVELNTSAPCAVTQVSCLSADWSMSEASTAKSPACWRRSAIPEVRKVHNFLARLPQLQPTRWQLMSPGERFQGQSIASARREVHRCCPLVHLPIQDDSPARLQALDNNDLMCLRKTGHLAREGSTDPR